MPHIPPVSGSWKDFVTFNVERRVLMALWRGSLDAGRFLGSVNFGGVGIGNGVVVVGSDDLPGLLELALRSMSIIPRRLTQTMTRRSSDVIKTAREGAYPGLSPRAHVLDKSVHALVASAACSAANLRTCGSGILHGRRREVDEGRCQRR